MASLSLEDIEALAPDQASLKAASKLLKPAKWPLRETDGHYIWAECQGSGSNPYRVIFDLRDNGSKCTCPSRKFPCKHALAMGLMFAGAPDDFSAGTVPEWGSDWIGRRRKTTAKPATDENAPKPVKNLKAALQDEPEKAIDPKKAAAQEAARQKRAESTHTAQMAGLLELEDWIFDNLSLGVPQILSDLTDRFRTIAARMADAKAASLSGRLDDIPERIISLPSTMRADALIEEMGKLVLLARAAQSTPKPVGVQRLIANAESRETILSTPEVLIHSADWQVVANHTRSRKDGLVSYTTWLLSLEDTPRFAQLLDFVPAASGQRGTGFSVGDVFQAEIAYFPSEFPLRATIRDRQPCTRGAALTGQIPNTQTQIATHLRAEPWTQDIPLLLGPGRIGAAPDGTLFWAPEDGSAMPTTQTHLPAVARALPLEKTVALLRNGRLLLLASQTELGVLYYDE